MIRLKRIYEPPSRRDGLRILVDRVWPRRVSKQTASIDEWRKELAPSPALRKWFGHDPVKWNDFRAPVTLLYGAADERHNQAVALKAFLDELEWESRH